MKKRKIIWQIYPTYLIILFISLIAVSWIAFSSFKSFYLIQATDDLQSRAHIFRPQLTRELLRSDPAKVDALCKKIGEASGTRITVILPSGWVIGDSDEDTERMEIHSTREEILAAKENGVGRAIRYSSTLEQKMMYVAVAVEERGERIFF